MNAPPQHRFPRWTFRLAGLYGLLVLILGYFSEPSVSRQYPPAVTHLEYYYGFMGVALAFQFIFLVISTDPPRYRPVMPVCVLEKLAFFVPVTVLLARGQVPPPTVVLACVDMTLGVLFLVAWLRISPPDRAPARASEPP
jgi:hypothetical protein